jgi:hypothetical protein
VPPVHQFPSPPELPPENTLQALAETNRQELQQAGITVARDQNRSNTCGMPLQPTYLTRVDFSPAVAARFSVSRVRSSRMASMFARHFCLSEPLPIASVGAMR